MIGKRKRETTVASRSRKTDDSPSPAPAAADNAQDIFRKYFESQFEPLDLPSPRPTEGLSSEDEGDEDDSDVSESEEEWGGASDEDDEGEDGNVEVVEYKDTRMTPDLKMDKKARKAFMNAKPPSSLEPPIKSAAKSNKKEESEEENEADNLKHDLALQRLLRESHLLDSAEDLAPTGKNRHKALDLRMQSLGAKTSLYKQQNMPDSHRRGIKAKAAAKEEKRRKEAKENGIILEKPAKVNKSSAGRRDRGIGGSSIGKFSGGTLNLSKRDLHVMQGPKGRSEKGKGKKGCR